MGWYRNRMIAVVQTETGWETITPAYSIKKRISCKVMRNQTLEDSYFEKEEEFPSTNKKYKFFRDALDHAHSVNKELSSEIRIVPRVQRLDNENHPS